MDIYKNKGKLSILFILIFLSLSNLNTCFLAKYLSTTIDEFMQNSREHLSLFYTHLVGILLFIVPLSTLYSTIVAIKRNTRITKDRQFILFTHLVYCFFVSHLLTFLFMTLINVGFARMTNNPISFLSISYQKYGEATHGKIYSLFYLSSAVFTTVNFLQYFIIGEFIFLMILFSRRVRNIPVSMQIVNDFENSYVHHTIPSLILYTAFLIRLYYVTNGLVCMLTFVFYSNAVSYVSIMLSLMTYWMTHGAMLSPRRYNTVR